MVNKWITDNYDDLKRTTYNILGEDNYHEVDDLLHTCIEMFIKNKNAQGVVERGEAKWFFIRILLNQHRSKTSYYHKTYRKHTSQYLDQIKVDELEDEVYDYDMDDLIEFNLRIIEQMLVSNDPKERYYSMIMMVYFSNGFNFAEGARCLDISRTHFRRQFDEGAKMVLDKMKRYNKDIEYNELPLKILATKLLEGYGKKRRF